MTCRHGPNYPNCSSSAEGAQRAAAEARQIRETELRDRTPDPDEYMIVDVLRVGPHLVLKVKYPSCVKCAFEGLKVMVFLNVTEADALRWRCIDPHFRDSKVRLTEAPSPAARFPATPEGWTDAIAYARSKLQAKT